MPRHRACVFSLVILSALDARAQAPVAATSAAADLWISDCPEELAGALPAVVKLEIDVLLREHGAARDRPERVAVRCAGDQAHIDVTLDGTSRDSTLQIGALAPEHRARAVALATAELVHSLSNRSAAPGKAALPRAIPEPVPPPPAPSATPSTPRPRPALFLGGLAESLGKPPTLLLGARAAFHYPLGRTFVPALAVDGSFGGFSSSQSARIAVSNLSTAIQLYLGTTTGQLRWEVGPGARLGWVHLAGEPSAGTMLDGYSLAGVWTGPELRARVQYGAQEQRSLRLALELAAGFVVLPVRGLLDGTEPIYAVEGPWISVCASLGLGL